MLTELSIKNYALIRSLEMTPAAGLNIITGETGAGKSIMLGAVSLLLGKRADTKILLNDTLKCTIEGGFNISNYNLETLFELLDLDYDDQTIIRREINPNGKSRAFINDIPVTLDVLKNIGLKLLDIHSQHESMTISKKSAQLEVIDGFSQNVNLLKDYKDIYSEHNKISKELNLLSQEASNVAQDIDYNNFLITELSELNLVSGEQEALEKEIKVLENSEEIKLNLSQVVNELKENDFSINDRLGELSRVLIGLSNYSNQLNTLSERFFSTLEEFKDIGNEIENIQNEVEHNPERIAEINDRLGLIYQLQQKHKVNSVEELLQILSKLENSLASNANLNDQIANFQKKLEQLEKELIQKAELLSESRREVLDDFSDKLNKLLQYVGIPEGHVQLVYKRIKPINTGIDEVELLFSANKGVKPEPIKMVASGGEFSRLMFCVKYLLADKTSMPTIIFDEIDTGVSGEIAIKMANMMKKMALRHQVISISHLPQVAAKGDAHYFVYKNNESEKSESLIKKLEESERIDEIAKMIGGANPTEAAIKNAVELIGQ